MTRPLTIYPVAPMAAVAVVAPAPQPAPTAAERSCAWGDGECREPAGHGITGRFCAEHAAWLAKRAAIAARDRKRHQRVTMKGRAPLKERP